MPVKDKKYNRDSGKVLGPVESTLRVALEAFGMAEVSSLCSQAHSASVLPQQKVVAAVLPLQDPPFSEPKSNPFCFSPNIWPLGFICPPLAQSTVAREAKDWWFQRADGMGMDKGGGSSPHQTSNLIHENGGSDFAQTCSLSLTHQSRRLGPPTSGKDTEKDAPPRQNEASSSCL